MKIIWTLDSKEDLQAIRAHIKHFSTSLDSKEVLQGIRKSVSILLEFPRLGHPVGYSKRIGSDVRMIVLGITKVYYSLVGDEIRILRVWDARQNPDRLTF